MLKIPKTVECALKIYWVIAHTDAEWVPGALIQRQCRFKPGTSAAMLHRLSKRGLLLTVRGRRGGYKVPCDITLRQIIEAVCPNQCPHSARSCNIVVQRLEKFIISFINQTVAMPKQNLKQQPTDGEPIGGVAVPERTTDANC